MPKPAEQERHHRPRRAPGMPRLERERSLDMRRRSLEIVREIKQFAGVRVRRDFKPVLPELAPERRHALVIGDDTRDLPRESVDHRAGVDRAREVQIIADKRTPYRTLVEVLYTMGQSEFKAMRFVVLKKGAAG